MAGRWQARRAARPGRAVRYALRRAQLLGGRGRHEEALELYRQVVDDCGRKPEPAAEVMVAEALCRSGYELAMLDRLAEAVAAWEQVEARFAAATDPAVRDRVALASANRAEALAELGRWAQSLEVAEKVLAEHGGEHRADVWGTLAVASAARARALAGLGRWEEALELAEEVIDRWGRVTGTAESVALALLVTGLALEHLGRLDEAVATFHGVTTVYKAFRPVRRHVAAAQDGLRRLRPDGPSAG